MVYIIPNFLVGHFGENFMKIRSKIQKLQMHEKLHKNVNKNMFFNPPVLFSQVDGATAFFPKFNTPLARTSER